MLFGSMFDEVREPFLLNWRWRELKQRLMIDPPLQAVPL